MIKGSFIKKNFLFKFCVQTKRQRFFQKFSFWIFILQSFNFFYTCRRKVFFTLFKRPFIWFHLIHFFTLNCLLHKSRRTVKFVNRSQILDMFHGTLTNRLNCRSLFGIDISEIIVSLQVSRGGNVYGESVYLLFVSFLLSQAD